MSSKLKENVWLNDEQKSNNSLQSFKHFEISHMVTLEDQ